MLFNDLLKEIRTELDLTQEEFAHELNVSFSTLSRWENGHTVPSRLAKMSIMVFCKKHYLSPQITEQLSDL